MPPRKKRDATPNDERAVDYRYTGEKRTNIPPARIAGEGIVPTVPKARYAYSPHLSPTLQFDPTGEPDKLDALVDKATKGALTAGEATRLRDALRVKEPTLEWAGKREQREKGYLEVDPVALHIHERVSARAIIRSALREDVQRDLFADPQQPYKEAVQFYKHDVDWANRLILGDSLQVMSSLARRENLAGKVQMIYMDPPYGIKFASNFQSEIGKRDTKETEADLTREPEMVRAYRDTWALGVHSYMSYVRDRLGACREMLADSGSIFVQISDENVHRLSCLMDEVFGASNAISIISVKKTGGATSSTLPSVVDYILWYARDAKSLRYRQIYLPKILGEEGSAEYTNVELPSGKVVKLESESDGDGNAHLGSVFATDSAVSDGFRKNTSVPFTWAGITFDPGPSRNWKTTIDGMMRLCATNRIVRRSGLRIYKRYFSDFPYRILNNVWMDVRGAVDRQYVVQTSQQVVARCMLMTTEPGDLVFDPTCGSGTTAIVAEQWGRRWITVDTSRVALNIARQRILTARFDLYRLRESPSRASSDADPKNGFVYKTAPHITLKSIALNTALDPIVERHERRLDQSLRDLASVVAHLPSPLQDQFSEVPTKNSRSKARRAPAEKAPLRSGELRWWDVPLESDESWPDDLTAAWKRFRSDCQERIIEINAAIGSNADREELVDQPEVIRGKVRVSGPFTVEGVRPEELNIDGSGLFAGTRDDFDASDDTRSSAVDQQNVHAYLERMIQLIRQDGLTFLNNQRRKFVAVEPLFDAGTGTMLHAEASWSDAALPEVLDVAIGFGPQYGPVTVEQVEGLIRSTKRHKDLVIAGFSFDADATAMIQEQSHPKLRIHQAYIRPDVNPGMDGLLKDTPNSQLFTVFGTPEIELSKTKDGEQVVELKGVDIYDPVANTVRSTGADKVAAWFLDSDFDGRCFCVTQAFFPDQDAWEKIAKALGSAADADAFEAFKGTTSIPFVAGKHKRIAVKVIDPRGNEVMVVRPLDA